MSTAQLSALAALFRSPSRANAHAVYIRSAILAVFLGCVLFVLYKSAYSPKPIVLTDVVVLINHESLTGNIQLIETRRFEGKSDETVGVIRDLYAEGDYTRRIALEGGFFAAAKGPFSSTAVLTLPESIRGRWCLKTTYTWWPSWSQVEFDMDSPPICFETTPHA